MPQDVPGSAAWHLSLFFPGVGVWCIPGVREEVWFPFTFETPCKLSFSPRKITWKTVATLFDLSILFYFQSFIWGYESSFSR